MTFKMTSKELDKLVNGEMFDRFDVVFDDIPIYMEGYQLEKGETHHSYIEDDGREYRVLILKDLKTNNELSLNYTFNREWPNDLMDVPKWVELVKDEKQSDFYKEPVVVPPKEEVLTPEQQADKDLVAKYQAVKPECATVEVKQRLKVPKRVIDDILHFLANEKFNMYQLRGKVYPVAIEYRLEADTFWRWLQNKAYSARKR